MAFRLSWKPEQYLGYVTEANQPGSEDSKLVDQFICRLQETLDQRVRYWKSRDPEKLPKDESIAPGRDPQSGPLCEADSEPSVEIRIADLRQDERNPQLENATVKDPLGANSEDEPGRAWGMPETIPEEASVDSRHALEDAKELGSREERLQAFLREHRETTLADIMYSARIHKPDFQEWRRDKMASASVMAKRIENVLTGVFPLKKKPVKQRDN
jgi:hypothetical protein